MNSVTTLPDSINFSEAKSFRFASPFQLSTDQLRAETLFVFLQKKYNKIGLLIGSRACVLTGFPLIQQDLPKAIFETYLVSTHILKN